MFFFFSSPSILYVPPSRSCGPFRLNSISMWESISEEIAQAPHQLQNALTIISSTTVAVPIIVVLALIAYYFQVR